MTRTDVGAAVFLGSAVACGASMRPIPDDVEPAPRSVAVAPFENAPAQSSRDAGGHSFASARPNRPQSSGSEPACEESHRPLEVRHVAPDRWIIDNAVLRAIRLEGKSTFAPVLDANGQVLGLTIRDVGSDACLAALGFEDGDVIRTINGSQLLDWTGGFSAVYPSIQKDGVAVVRFERAGRPMTAVYEVKTE